MIDVVNKEVLSFLFKGEIPNQGNISEARQQKRERLNVSKADVQNSTEQAIDNSRQQDDQPVETVVRDQPKIGRNDPCTCGSGKKYKKCCLKN